ncbi:MAG: ribosomal protein [Chlamydiota bacterium]|jgi:large subunit ribosomal protein L25
MKELTVTPRESNKKSDAKKLRREGQIPAVLYGMGNGNQNVAVQADVFRAILRGIRPGMLPTTIFTLIVNGKPVQALVKDVQYQHATYEILHIDFLTVGDGAKVAVRIPVRVAGAAECVGIKLGGFLRQVIRFIDVECKLADIPEELTVDVKELNIAQSKRLSDVNFPSGVKPLAKLSEVAVVIGKKA